ncbi:hypothetical protein PI125_g25113 [Phytophthora idaei]|nr:hypothetical protein PI125_g25113 [Phytophthora idaei]
MVHSIAPLIWPRKYKVDQLLAIYGIVGSQNGFDNSGKTLTMNTQPVGALEHWPVRPTDAMRRHRRPGAIYDLERGLDYVCGCEHVDCSEIDTKFLTLETRADWAFDKFW